MFIAKELIAKGLLATAATATAITLAVVYGDNIAKYMSSEDEEKLIGEVGLECNGLSTATETNGVVCTKRNVEGAVIKVKKGESPSFNVSTITTGSTIRVYKLTGRNDYKQGLKFVIEGGDVGDTNNKLKEFETYGIEKDGSEWKLTRKTDVNAEIKKALGLPEDEACNLPTAVGNEVECDIAGDKFKNIKFEGLVKAEASVEGTPKLKISKVEDSNEDYGNYKLKFVLASEQQATIANGKFIKANTNTEFKIKVTAATDQTAKTISLEKAWTVAKLAQKIGVAATNGCNGETEQTKECTLGTSINVFNNESNYVVGATVTGGSTHKLTFLTEQPDYNQGYKFTVTAGAAISLTAPTGGSGTTTLGTVNSIETGGDGYEIKEQTVGTAKK